MTHAMEDPKISKKCDFPDHHFNALVFSRKIENTFKKIDFFKFSSFTLKLHLYHNMESSPILKRQEWSLKSKKEGSIFDVKVENPEKKVKKKPTKQEISLLSKCKMCALNRRIHSPSHPVVKDF